MTCSFLLQACVAVPPEENRAGKRVDYKDKYADRFSISGIKQRREQEYAQKLAGLKQLNPIEDAQKAAADDKYYYLSYQLGRGGNLKIPGLSEQQSQNTRCSLKQLDGMGDTIYGVNHQEYRTTLRKYANQFNKTMFAFCRN